MEVHLPQPGVINSDQVSGFARVRLTVPTLQIQNYILPHFCWENLRCKLQNYGTMFSVSADGIGFAVFFVKNRLNPQSSSHDK